MTDKEADIEDKVSAMDKALSMAKNNMYFVIFGTLLIFALIYIVFIGNPFSSKSAFKSKKGKKKSKKNGDKENQEELMDDLIESIHDKQENSE